MDRKTLLAFSLIAIVLILTPWYMNFVAPQPEAVPQDSVSQVGSPSTSEQLKNGESTSLGPIKRRTPDNDEKSIVINNGLFTATLSSAGGGSFSSFVLNNYGRFDSTSVNTIDTFNKENLILGFISLDGDNVLLNKNWDLAESSKSISVTGKQRSVLFSTVFDGYLIKKIFTFYPNTYKIGVDVSFEQPEKFISRGQYTLSWSGGLAPSEKNIKDDFTHFKGYAYLGDELLEPTAKEGLTTQEKQTGKTNWTAVKTKYFISAIIPDDPGVGASVVGTMDENRPIFSTHLRQSTSARGGFHLYMGPLEYSRIRNLGVDLEKTMDLGWTIIRPLGRLVTWSLTKMHSAIPNYGIVVIIFAILVKILLNPLTKKSFQSTRKMQEVQPEIQKLKEKYKNDQQKLSKAQMELFKERGVNPMGGCLPMLLQMPILITFFSVFRSTIEFRGAPFFGWITDLSTPDTLTTIAGYPLNVLPFLMGITMFLQQKFMAPSGGGTQQKVMMYFMNVFFLFIFYSFPSGLNLYYSVFNILSIVQQKYLTPAPAIT
ncbi:MAG: membrane protein insertase YidC, partial [Candidatus Marinimicrobia bacterium]|nr:membrane protein insertase YidC [Candidatus Neomarinimicrobiota bacterium]MBT7193932.1 membrane protein insertase YidC [Candidatus Neomarinimicrobiota bacterium]